MFKLNKYKSGKGSPPKFDFQFSDFQAIKVPKGWDKLFVSLVSVETGKTSVKSRKSSVRNGICRWTETLSESFFLALDKGNINDESCLCRFVVAMGSSRSGVLGEVTVNLADYASSKASVPLSLLLKKCNYGTSLQFKIQCLTPKANDRDSLKYTENGNDDMENRSDASDGSFSRSHLESTSTAGLSRDPSLSASDSRRSFESIEASPRHDSQNNHSSSPYAFQQDSPSRFNTGPSKDLLEAAEGTIEELRAEARMWEHNAKKLTHEMEVLRRKMSDQGRSQETLSADFDDLHKEMEEEIRFQKESNADLTEQLEKTKESNAELLSILQELETIVETQKAEIETLSSQKLKLQETQNEKIEVLSDSSMSDKFMDSIQDHNEPFPEGIQNLKLQLQQLQETKEELEREKNSYSEHLEELKKENKVLERLSSELGKGKEDLENELTDLEKENIQLTERISAMEAQLRYLNDEKEKCVLDLRQSESQSMELRDEIGRLELVLHTQRAEVKRKVPEMEKRWYEAQEECEYLKKANQNLQSMAENLIEESTSLQKLNGELRRQNVSLSKQCTLLESQSRDTQEKLAECSEKIKALEGEFLMILEKVSVKEQSLNSELESLVIEDREHREKVMQENVSLNELCNLKVVEVETLQKELVHLMDQIGVDPDESGMSVGETRLEMYGLHSEKNKLEASLRELTNKFTLSQNKLTTLEVESEAKVQQLTGELTSLRKSHEDLLANHENLSASLESFKSKEVKHKSYIKELEIDLKALKYEKLQLKEEISSLKEQLKRANLIQDEVLDLKTSLTESKSECERVKSSLKLLRGDHEELRTEKESLAQKVSTMKKTMLELEDCQRSKIALEERVLRLEGDLAANKALCAQNAELKFELNKIKRANGEFQRKIKHLEQDLEGYPKKGQEKLQPEEVHGVDNADYLPRIQCLKSELAEALEVNDMYKAEAQLRRFISEEQSCSDNLKTSGDENALDAERQGSSLEVDLKDLREKYFQLSLKYAEVEAQREELVLKLKTTHNKKGWFF